VQPTLEKQPAESPTGEPLNLEQYTWRPNPGQQEFCLTIPGNVFEILYGGARGGGKTDCGIMWLIKPVRELGFKSLITHPNYRALVLRRNGTDLGDWIDRAERVFKLYGASLKDKNKAAYFLFPSGAKIHLGHLKDEEAYTKYQGHEYQRMLIEELTQIQSEMLYTKLIGSCRSKYKELRPQVLCTTNPGGKGHGWVRRRFVSAAPPNEFFINPATNRIAIYVPAKLEDNPFLMASDPDYVNFLEGLKVIDEKLYRAWRNGEWDAFEGQVFSEWNYAIHTFKKFWVPLTSCRRIASFDWGYRSPASMHWTAETPENAKGVRHVLTYREVYRTQMTPKMWGQLMARLQATDPIDYLVLPHDCFASDQGQLTIAQQFEEEFKKVGVHIAIVRGATMAKGARLSRLGLAHSGLSMSADGYPYWMIHESCTNLIRTLPELPYSETMVEDVDTESEDHAYDSSTLGLMTLQPKFGQSELVAMHPQQKGVVLKHAWQQTTSGQTVAGDILQSLAKPQPVRTADGEY
jgi:hypothetical protein